jgi:hypothetical protein
MRSADTVYVTDTGLRLCGLCAHKAEQGVLIVEEIILMSVLTGERHVYVERQDLTGQVHTTVEQYPVDGPTACETCLMFLAPAARL